MRESQDISFSSAVDKIQNKKNDSIIERKKSLYTINEIESG